MSLHFTHGEPNSLNWSRMILKSDFITALEEIGRLPLRNTKQVMHVHKENKKLQKLVDAVMTHKQKDYQREIEQLNIAIEEKELAYQNELGKK